MKIELASRLKGSRREIVLANITSTRAQAETLARLYLRVVAQWDEQAVAITASYERALSDLTTDAPNDPGEVIESIAAAIRRVVLLLTPELRDWALRVEEVHRGKWIRSVLSATSVDLTTLLTAGDVAETVATAIEWNIALIRDVSDEIRRKITNAVFSGFQQRRAARDIAKDIREATGLARKRSLRIAADQTVKLGARLNRARQEQAGLTHFKWRHSGKAHPRSWHRERDGKVYPWTGPGSIAPDDQAGVPPFCGCTAQGVLTSDGQ